jgi:hypothetical protein
MKSLEIRFETPYEIGDKIKFKHLRVFIPQNSSWEDSEPTEYYKQYEGEIIGYDIKKHKTKYSLMFKVKFQKEYESVSTAEGLVERFKTKSIKLISPKNIISKL